MNRLAEGATLALEPRERDLVLGDLAECGVSGRRAFFEVLGLVVRRQALIWTGWRPWFGLIGIAGVSGFYLSRMFTGLSMKIFQQTSTWRHFGVHYNVGVTSFRDDVIHIGCLAAAIFCWTAVNASVLKRFSGRAFWLTGLVFWVVVHGSGMAWAIFSGAAVIRGNSPWWTFLRPVLPLYPVSVCLFLIPAICGVRRRFPAMIPLTVVCTIAAALLGEYHAHDLERFSGGAFRPGLWPAIIAPYVLVSWPVVFARSGQPRRG